MLPKLIKKGWVEILVGFGFLIAYGFHLLAVIMLYNEGNAIFSHGKLLLPVIYIGAMWLFSRSKLLYAELPTSSKHDGFSQIIKHDDWKAILEKAIAEDHTPLSEDEKFNILFGFWQADPNQVESWSNRNLTESSEELATTRSMNPFLTLDRVRFASWVVRELKQNPELLESVVIRGKSDFVESDAQIENDNSVAQKL